MNQQAIIDKVLSYMGESENLPHYAIAMHGAWGSGKTHFCEHKLKSALDNNNYRMLRISLFGVASIEGFYERALSSCGKLKGIQSQKVLAKATGGANAALSVAKAATNQFLPQLGKIIADSGFQIAIKPETALSMIPMEKTLVVLDDIERSKLESDPTIFFGLVNELAENQGWHIMLVTNEPLPLSDRSIEKTVLWQMEYEPAIDELFESIAGKKPFASTELDFDAKKAALQGVRSIANVNARSLIKCLWVLKTALDSPALLDKRISPENRASAFTDFTRYAMLAAAGDQPKPQSDVPQEERDYLASIEYENYKPLEEALTHLTTDESVSPETVHQCLDTYIQERYPESQAELSLNQLYRNYQHFSEMEDYEVDKIINDLSAMLRARELNGKCIYKAWMIYKDLSAHGFCEILKGSEVVNELTRITDVDPETSAKALRSEYKTWKDAAATEPDATLDSLLEHAENKLIEAKRSAILDEPLGPDTGEKLAQMLTELLKDDSRLDTVVPAAFIAKAFIEGNAESQNSLRRFFLSEQTKAKLAYDHVNEACLWMKNIKAAISEEEPRSKTGAIRTNWLIENIDKTLSELGWTKP